MKQTSLNGFFHSQNHVSAQEIFDFRTFLSSVFSISNAQVVVCLENGKIHIIVIIFNHNKLKYLVCLLLNVIILS